MKGSPAKARVVYAPVLEVGEEGRLVRACRILSQLFSSFVFCKHISYSTSIMWDVKLCFFFALTA
jgi:hypothetical protein